MSNCLLTTVQLNDLIICVIFTIACPVVGQVRIPCASPCDVTCANMDEVLICPTVCVTNGCQCPRGTVIDEQSNTCVASSDCPTGTTVDSYSQLASIKYKFVF